MKGNLLIFGGTTEGRILAEACSSQGRPVVVCTATGYGQGMVAALPHVAVHAGRMDAECMVSFIKNGKFTDVIDATHPYALEVTENIKAACARAECPYLRVIREDTATDEEGGIFSVPDEDAAVTFLSGTTGNIFLATGSKSLSRFCALPGYASRLYVRVLPDAGVIAHCNALGLLGKHIIAMQGPFPHSLNVALLRHLDCRYLVTKSSGKEGGLEAKISAAREVEAQVVVVRRQTQDTGYTLAEIMRFLELEHFRPGNAPVK